MVELKCLNLIEFIGIQFNENDMMQTFLNVIRPHETLPKTESSTRFWAATIKMGHIFHIPFGNRYQSILLIITRSICSNAVLNRSPHSHATNIAIIDQKSLEIRINIVIELFALCYLKIRTKWKWKGIKRKAKWVSK